MAVVGGLALGWSALAVRSMLRAPSSAVRWVLPIDVAVLSLVAITQPWTTPPEAYVNGGTGWGLVLVSLAMLAWQLHVPVRPAIVAWFVVITCMIGGGLLAPTGFTSGYGFALMWITMESLLTRMLWLLVWRASQRADLAIADAEAAREESEVAAARRTEERAYAAMLHDTAASTLLMVGLGAVGRDADWLRVQARRDLERLSDEDRPAPVGITLAGLLAGATAERPDLRAAVHEVPLVELDPSVADAVHGAVREALTNVARHAGVAEVEVRGLVDDSRVILEIVDAGRGFSPDLVGPTRRGVSHSIVKRMRRISGNAVITSRPGHGTCVRLEWPR